jgi:phosphatidylinositol alpha-mannosyltransferase
MHIGIVTQSFYPIKGGVTEHVNCLYRGLEKLGHEVTIITANFTGFDDDYGMNVVRIGRDLTVPINGAFCNMTVGLELVDKLKQIEKEKKFDLVHIHCPMNPVLPLLAINHLKAPKIGTFHTLMDRNVLLEIFKERLKSYVDRLDGRIAVSEVCQEFTQKYFPGEYRVIPNGVDTNRFSPQAGILPEYKDENLKILFVGRMDPRKGFKYLLQAFPIVYQRLPKVKLIVVGNGFLRYWYNLSLPSILQPRVDYLGFVTADKLPQYYSSCDIYCSPATHGESFGIVLLEAMASGKPIVASNIKGYNSLVKNNQEGILVEPKNPLQLAEALIELGKNKKKREQMAKKGREKALKFSWDKVVKEIENYYFEVLDKVKKKK